ncbi:hypothetical protein RAS1_07220 [Phycisphaerae bacterium RAS1]|nr:hypothetical protein RAS1_07220 [Phycisphaerae bacterium RAS1]
MSAIPPGYLSSIIQTSGAQSRAAETKSRDDQTQAQRTGEKSFADNLQNVIEESDQDSAVFADAEGRGGQGRSSDGSDQPPADPAPADAEQADDGSLDISA